MKNNTSRRTFLKNTLLVTGGAALASSPLYALSDLECPYDGYNPFADQKTDLRKSNFLGEHVTVKGTVYDSSGNLPVSGATLEVWHLSPNSKKYRHRGKVVTNNIGQYQFTTDFPNNVKGKIARIYFKVNYGADSYFTDLAITKFQAYVSDSHWVKNNQLGTKIFPSKKTFLNHSTISFNLSI
jgi:hypothetical protein